ncbi:hypothetical protein ACJMK2_008440 [Sinanodonta woodiana]|uniref:YqaJ viral recombinase domain-containing protein n=1 Tax=Sinanodonta woodiana TaxID=1069815 RepID=A0ABD3VLL1_SINWO
MDTNKAVNKTGDLEHLSAHLSGNKAELLKKVKGVADLGIQMLKEINVQDRINEEYCTHGFVKCKVIPSLPTLAESKKPDYDSCNHVAGLLYALVDISSKKKDGLNSPTFDACKWNKPRLRKLSPKKSQDLTFKKLKFSKECPLSLETKSQAKPIVNISPDLPIKPVDVMEFTPYQEHKVQNLYNIDHMYYDKADLQSDKCIQYFNDYFASLHCKKEECDRIQAITKGQANNKNWFAARTSRKTGSKFGCVCKLKKTTSLNSTVREVMEYTVLSLTIIHTDIIVIESGLCVNERFSYLSCIPDGLVTCKHCEESLGLIEVKCPFKFRDMTPSFYCQVIGGELKLKKRIFFDKRFWFLMLEKLNSFYLKAIISELFSERIKFGLSLYKQ